MPSSCLLFWRGSQLLTNPESFAPQGCTQLAAGSCGNSGAGWHGSCHGPRHETHKESHWQGTGSTSGFDSADPQLGDTGRLCYTGKGTKPGGLVMIMGSCLIASLMSHREQSWTPDIIQNVTESVILPKASSLTQAASWVLKGQPDPMYLASTVKKISVKHKF